MYPLQLGTDGVRQKMLPKDSYLGPFPGAVDPYPRRLILQYPRLKILDDQNQELPLKEMMAQLNRWVDTMVNYYQDSQSPAAATPMMPADVYNDLMQATVALTRAVMALNKTLQNRR